MDSEYSCLGAVIALYKHSFLVSFPFYSGPITIYNKPKINYQKTKKLVITVNININSNFILKVFLNLNLNIISDNLMLILIVQ